MWTLRGDFVKNWDQKSFWKFILQPSTEYYHYEQKNGRISPDVNVAMMFLAWVKENVDVLDEYSFMDKLPIDDDALRELTIDDLQQKEGIFWNQHTPLEIDNNNTRQYYTLDIGYDSVCKRLFADSSSYEFNDFIFEYNVIAIDKKSSKRGYKYRITLQNVKNSKQIRYVYANHVISTMAPQQLEVLLENINFGSNTQHYNDYIQNTLLNSVQLDESYKVSLIYDDKWWQEENLFDLVGHLLTDMDIQTVLMEEAWTNDTLTVVHVYSWGPTQSDLWNRLQKLGSPYISDESIEINNEASILLASDKVVEELIRQLEILTEIDNIPYPLAAYSSPLGWDVDFNSGAYRWRAGYNPEFTLDNIIRPIENENFYIATSSISPYQAWMYGCLWATLKNLQENFGIPSDALGEETCVPAPVTPSPTTDSKECYINAKCDRTEDCCGGSIDERMYGITCSLYWKKGHKKDTGCCIKIGYSCSEDEECCKKKGVCYKGVCTNKHKN